MKKSLVMASMALLLIAVAVDWQPVEREVQAADQEVEAARAEPNVDPAFYHEMAETAARTFEATYASYHMGTEIMANVYVWSRRWLDAERALAKTDAEELAALRAHRERMKKLMMYVRALYTTGSKGGEVERFYATKYYLAEADTWLAAAKNRKAQHPVRLKKVTLSFRGPRGMVVTWDERNSGKFDSERLVCPSSQDFIEGRVYFLQFSGVGDVKLLVMLDLRFAIDKPLPIELSLADVKQAASKHTLSKVFARSSETGAVKVLSEWDDLRDGVVAEAEREGEVVAVMHVAPFYW